MVGASLTFYKITVTAALSKAVQTGSFSDIEPRVLCHILALPRSNKEMCPLPNRLKILRSKNSFRN